MNDGVTLSTFEIFQLFPDAEKARLYLESRRWKNGKAEAQKEEKEKWELTI